METETSHGCIQMDDSTRDQRKSMHELLWNHATQHITTKDYRTSVDFYTAALAYAEADAKAPIACQLAQAHLAVQKLQAERSAQPDYLLPVIGRMVCCRSNSGN